MKNRVIILLILIGFNYNLFAQSFEFPDNEEDKSFWKDISTAGLLIASGILFGEAERLYQGKGGWLDSPWYTGNNWQYDNPTVQWLMRYPFSFAKDGYHFTKSAAMFTASYALALNWKLVKSWGTFTNAIIYYIITGIAFNLSYH